MSDRKHISAGVHNKAYLEQDWSGREGIKGMKSPVTPFCSCTRSMAGVGGHIVGSARSFAPSSGPMIQSGKGWPCIYIYISESESYIAMKSNFYPGGHHNRY